MSKLKDINLKDLGLKGKLEKDIFLEKFVASEPEMKFSKEYTLPLANEFRAERDVSSPYFEHSSNMNSKFLKHIHFIENIKDKPGQYLDQRDQWEKELEPTEFVPPSKSTEKNIPLTFRKFFYQIFPHDINKFALQNPEKLPSLVGEIKDKIQKESSNWVDFICDKQVGNLICQVENYSSKAKIFKKSSEFWNIPQVIQWIIDTNTKLRYESTDWNKDQSKTFSKEKGNLLIIDISLFQSLEIAEKLENRQSTEKRKIPLPLHQVWDKFASVVISP